MAVKASANITLFHVIDIDSTTIYYLLQSSTANPPAKPTTDNPGGSWTTTEPTYTEGSTNTLYTVTKTKFSDGTFEYTPVSKSTAYEAAKTAYNKAVNANNTANTASSNASNALNKVNNLQVGGRNLILKTNQGSTNWTYSKANGTSTTETDGIGVHFNVTTASTSWQMITYNFDNSQVLLLEPYTEYVLSFDYKTNMGTSNFNASATVQQSNATNQLAIGGTATIINDGEWHRAVFILTSNGLTNNKSNQFVYLGGFNKLGDLYCKNIKFEKGNKPTDWSPAPEDIAADIKDVNDTVDETNRNVSDLSSRTGTLETDMDNKVDNSDFTDYKTYVVNTYATIQQTDDKISISINEATKTLVTKSEYSSTTSSLAEVRSYFDFASDGLTIGKSTSNTTLVLANDKLAFKLNGVEKAYMSPDSFVLKQLKTFKLGGFAFKVRANGNLALVWVGEEE